MKAGHLLAACVTTLALAGCGVQLAPTATPASSPRPAHVTGAVPSHCHARTADNGQPLPDPTCTPGVVDPTITQATFHQEICDGGTDRRRAPVSETNAFKRRIMAAYGFAGQSPSAFELDHFVPLSLGGTNDAGNLWPQRNDRRVGNSKDSVEDTLYHAVCAGRVTLVAAQQAIVADWTTALDRLGLGSSS